MPKKNGTREPSDEFKAGGIQLRSYGEKVVLKNMMDKADYVAFQERMQQQRPKLKQAVDDRIQRILQLLREYDPLDLIAPVAAARQLRVPTQYKESEEKQTQADVEYLLSLALAQPYPLSPKPVDDAAARSLSIELDALRNDTLFYYMTEASEGKWTLKEHEARFKIMMNTLWVRGDGFWPIMRQLYLDLFAPVERDMERILGFGPRDVLSMFERAAGELEDRVNPSSDQDLDWVAQAFPEWIADKSPDDFDSPEMMFAKFLLDKGIFKNERPTKDLFEISPASNKEQLMLATFSAEFGDNTDFLTQLPKWRGWPLNPTIVHEKPFVRSQGRLFMPDPAGTSRALRGMTEAAIKAADSGAYATYLERRDSFLEDKCLEVLQGWFGMDNVFSNLEYITIEDGVKKRCELDILVKYGGRILLVEAKAGVFGDDAKRGGLKSVRGDLKEIVAKAHQQAERAARYIQSASTVSFVDKADNPITTVSKDSVTGIAMLNVTLEHLGHLTTSPPLLTELGILKGPPTAWSVSLPDFIVIRELIESPVHLLHYLDRRMPLLQLAEVSSSDELDLVMSYLKGELPTGISDRSGRTLFVVTSYTDELDQYYFGIERGYPVRKPTPNLPEPLDLLCSLVEARPADEAIPVLFPVLDCPEEVRKRLAASIRKLEEAVLRDTKRHFFVHKDRQTKVTIVLTVGETLLTSAEAAEVVTTRVGRRRVEDVVVLSWTPPLGEGKLDLFLIKP